MSLPLSLSFFLFLSLPLSFFLFLSLSLSLSLHHQTQGEDLRSRVEELEDQLRAKDAAARQLEQQIAQARGFGGCCRSSPLALAVILG